MQEQDVSMPERSHLCNANVHFFHGTVNSIALVKPEKARAVENLLIQMAQTGQLTGKVSTVTNQS